MTKSTVHLDPEIVTHESFLAVVGPIRESWDARHTSDGSGMNLVSLWHSKRAGEAPFLLMLAELTGRSVRRMRAYWLGHEPMSVSVADEILVALDRPDLFYQLDIVPRAAAA